MDAQTIWAKLMQNKSTPTPEDYLLSQAGQSVPNLDVMAAQSQPSMDALTLQQAQNATVPSQSNASRMLASAAAPSLWKDNSTQELDDISKDQGVLDSIGKEENELSDLKTRVKSYLDKPREANLSALAALTDAWSGSNFSKTYEAPETDAERAKTIAGLQNMIAQRSGDITKQKIDLQKEKGAAQGKILAAQKEQAPFLAALQDRQDQSAHQRTLQKVKSDKVVTDLFGKARNISNAQALLEQAKIVPPEQFDEFQSTIRRNLGMSGTSGVSEREATMFSNLGIKAARAQQYLFGKPSDVRESQAEFFQHLLDISNLIQKNNKSQISGRLKALTAGNGSMYRRRPDLEGDLSDLDTATLDQFSPDVLSPQVNLSKESAEPAAAGTDSARKSRIAELRAKLGK